MKNFDLVARKYFAPFKEASCIHLVGPFAKKCPPEPRIFVDRGSRLRKKNTGLSMGDGDSYAGKLDILLPDRKAYSDLSFALSLIPKSIKQIHLWGFLGGRRDHELINFAEVHNFLLKRSASRAVFDQGEVQAFSAGSFAVKSLKGCFSLFAFQASRVTLTGSIEYPLEKNVLRPHSSHGLSNFSKGDFSLSCSNPVLLFKN